MKANVTDQTYWWASEDPAKVVERLSPSNDQTSVYGNTALQQAWFRNIVMYFSNIVKADGWDTGLNFTGGQAVGRDDPEGRDDGADGPLAYAPARVDRNQAKASLFGDG